MENIFSIKENNAYIDVLINQTFSILPLYEEDKNSKFLSQKITNLTYRLNGFFKINDFDTNITIDILALVNELGTFENHAKVRNCVLRVCSLLSRLRVVVEE